MSVTWVDGIGPPLEQLLEDLGGEAIKEVYDNGGWVVASMERDMALVIYEVIRLRGVLMTLRDVLEADA